MPIVNRIAEFHDEMTAWRRALHAHPETAFEEFRTADFVAGKLAEFGIEVDRGLGGTGVVGTLRGARGVGPAIGLRADMDALFIAEKNDFAHRSTQDGKMHACGHDGHTAMLLGAARYLAETRNFAGAVRFIFQPAEENEGGARVMIEDGLFEKLPMEAVFGMHNMPGIGVGEMAVRPGPIMAAFDVFDQPHRREWSGCFKGQPPIHPSPRLTRQTPTLKVQPPSRKNRECSYDAGEYEKGPRSLC